MGWGSNRALIREEYAKEQGLVSRKVTYQMECVGDQVPKQVDGYIYLLDLVDMCGNVHTVWGYGVPKIMTSSGPDLMPIRKLFPHIPDAAFHALATKDVDVLIGFNMNEMQPAGGIGMDKVGGMSALRSLFGTGWVLGGHHVDIKSAMPMPVASSAGILRIAKLHVQHVPASFLGTVKDQLMGIIMSRALVETDLSTTMRSQLCPDSYVYQSGQGIPFFPRSSIAVSISPSLARINEVEAKLSNKEAMLSNKEVMLRNMEFMLGNKELLLSYRQAVLSNKEVMLRNKELMLISSVVYK